VMRKGVLLIFSGPSGAGKGTICKALQQENPSLRLSVSATTRPPRIGEVDGVHYYFLKRETFQEMIQNEDFLEWAEVYGNYYGTPGRFVKEALDQGEDVILEIDIQGALQVKEKIPEAVLIFIAPPSKSELESRLTFRGTDSPEEIQKRLNRVSAEMELARRYDYIVINDSVMHVLEKIRAVITAEKLRPRYQEAFFHSFKNVE